MKPQYEYQRLQEQIASYRKDCVELETDIQQLKAEQKDNQYFISALQGKIEALDRLIATRDYFDSLHLEYCPECLTKIDDNVDEGHCRLCKSPVDNSKGKTQAIRIRLELDFQIRESRLLMQANENLLLEKEALLKTKQQLLATAQQQYDNAVKNVRSSQDEQIDQLIQEIGYKEGDINQYRTMLEQAERYMQVPSMMYPRLMFSNNMEDKGMEEERAKNFQRMIVKRLHELEAQKRKILEPGTLNFEQISN